MPSLWSSFTSYKSRWFKIGVNLVMIFIGLQFIELAYATQYFSDPARGKDIHVLYAMYLAFIAGLFPNYATIFASEVMNINRKSVRELIEILVFFVITVLLNVLVIYISINMI